MFMATIEEGLKEEGSRYNFSIKLMEKIQNRLAEEAWFCEKLITTETIMRKNPDLV